jgi:hypothetical protein
VVNDGLQGSLASDTGIYSSCKCSENLCGQQAKINVNS